MIIRRIEESDTKAVSDLIRKTISISNKKDYSEDIMDQLIEIETPEHVLERSSWTHFYVVLEGDDIIKVNFDEHGVKSIMCNHPFVSKGE